MKSYFKYEKQLMNKFLELSLQKNNKTIISIEVPTRWGNIDAVEIKNNYLPFTKQQSLVLSKVSNARLFLKIKENRGISKKKLLSLKGLSEKTIENSINQLLKAKLIIKSNDLYFRNVKFSFPRVIITGYEAKLVDYKKALFQAMINKQYVDYSYMIFPIDIAEKIDKKYHDFLTKNNIGLIGVSNNNKKTIVKAQRIECIHNYSRLVNIIQTNLSLQKEEASIYQY